MARKYVDPKLIDEELIRHLVDIAPDYPLPPMTETLPEKETEQKPLPKSSSTPNCEHLPETDYRREYLFVHPVGDRTNFHLSRQTKCDLENILDRTGIRRLSLTAFVDNILRHHIETYKDIIGGSERK